MKIKYEAVTEKREFRAELKVKREPREKNGLASSKDWSDCNDGSKSLRSALSCEFELIAKFPIKIQVNNRQRCSEANHLSRRENPKTKGKEAESIWDQIWSIRNQLTLKEHCLSCKRERRREGSYDSRPSTWDQELQNSTCSERKITEDSCRTKDWACTAQQCD